MVQRDDEDESQRPAATRRSPGSFVEVVPAATKSSGSSSPSSFVEVVQGAGVELVCTLV